MSADVPGIALTAIGMVTALGVDAITSCAAARAGLVNATELTALDFGGDARFGEETIEGPPGVFGHQVSSLAEGFTGPGKALTLGVTALLDLQSRRRLSEPELSRCALFVNYSDHFIQDVWAERTRREPVQDAGSPPPLPSDEWRKLTAGLVPQLAARSGLPFSDAFLRSNNGGHAGVAECIQQAIALMQSGAVERCIVGGIDSRVEARFLVAAAELNALKTSDNAVGLIPGEAAAFFLLERPGAAARAAPPPLAILGASAHTMDAEPLVSEQPPTARGLCSAIRSALSSDPQSARVLGLAVSDLNGTPRRATEWAYTLTRLHNETRLADLPKWYPAASFGDAGAALGAVGICLVARAFERGYARASSALVAMSSERGNKGAVTLRACH